MTNNEQSQASSEFQNFQSLAEKLMKVPQHELKEKIAEEEPKKDDRASDSDAGDNDRPSDES